MGYLHINNLYKDKDVLLFKECYAMEKIHGTSAHIEIGFENNAQDIKNENTDFTTENVKVNIFSGGEKYANFVQLFDVEFLKNKFIELNLKNIIIFGEAYGGKQQGMSDTYGKELKFVAFEVLIGCRWLSVPQAEQFCKDFGIEFVHYDIVSTDIAVLDALASAPSVQAKRNGILEDKIREGVVLRPLIEVTKNNGDRIIAKHKNEKFAEREHQPKLNMQDLTVLVDNKKIVDEWVTEMRLSHILGKFESYTIENIKDIIKLMQEDVLREGAGEILISEQNKALLRAIGSKTAEMFKQRLHDEIK